MNALRTAPKPQQANALSASALQLSAADRAAIIREVVKQFGPLLRLVKPSQKAVG